MKNSLKDADYQWLEEMVEQIDQFQNEKKKYTHSSCFQDQQPVQTLYGGAQLWSQDTCQKIAAKAQNIWREYAPDAETFHHNMNFINLHDFDDSVFEKVCKKLDREAIEDFRIDFEDGFGFRGDEEEDRFAMQAGLETAQAMAQSKLPRFVGIRIKPMHKATWKRAARTLDLYLTELLDHSEGKLPRGFTVTLPKITHPFEVLTLSNMLARIEEAFSLDKNELSMEIMVEVNSTILNTKGQVPLLELAKNAKGRLRGAHIGTYDYTADCHIVAAYQKMTHDSCSFAKHILKTSFADTGIWLSDGATNKMPVGPHKESKARLAKETWQENSRVVYESWQQSYTDILYSLRNGYYQGWDLHPGQLPIRYAALYSFFMESYKESAHRLKNFIDKAAQATLAGDIFDDAATGQGLLNYFLKGYQCGALTMDELLETGLKEEEFHHKSFKKIVEERSAI